MDDARTNPPLGQERHPDPWQDIGRRCAEAIPMVGAAATALVRLHASRARQAAERDARIARQLRAVYEAEARAAALVYGRARDARWLRDAEPAELWRTWRAGLAWAERDTRARQAVDAVEARLRERMPEVMARYDRLRAQGMTPVEAMTRTLIEEAQRRGQAWEHGDRRWDYAPVSGFSGSPAGTDLVAAGPGNAGQVRDLLVAHLQAVDEHLQTVQAQVPGDDHGTHVEFGVARREIRAAATWAASDEAMTVWAGQVADRERASAAADMGTPDVPLTPRVDEHAEGMVAGRVHTGHAEHAEQLAAAGAQANSMAALRAQTFPQPITAALTRAQAVLAGRVAGSPARAVDARNPARWTAPTAPRGQTRS